MVVLRIFAALLCSTKDDIYYFKDFPLLILLYRFQKLVLLFSKNFNLSEKAFEEAKSNSPYIPFRSIFVVIIKQYFRVQNDFEIDYKNKCTMCRQHETWQ